MSGSIKNVIHPDIAALPDGQALWFNGTTLENDEMAVQTVGSIIQTIPVPNVPFRYHRLASAMNVDGAECYIYHQLNDNTLAEEFWDGSGFWLPSSNISITTS